MILSTSSEEFLSRTAQHRLVPVVGEALSDFLTPAGIYATLPSASPRFLLESATGGERWGRYSFVGSGVHFSFRGTLKEGLTTEKYRDGRMVSSTRREGDLLDSFSGAMSDLNAFVDSRFPVFAQGAVGYFAYDMVRCFEKLPETLHKADDFPDLDFVIPEIMLILDHALQKIRIMTWVDRQDGDPARLYDEAAVRLQTFWEFLFLSRPLPKPTLSDGHRHFSVREVTDAERFKETVERAKEHIRAGDIFQVVLSRRFEFPWEGSPLTLYRVLRSINPSPYLYLIENGTFSLVGSSPELFVRVTGKTVDLRPIAGTVRRSGNPEEDERRSKSLLVDPKERAEHVMLVDLGRNDVGRIAEKGGG